MERSVRKPARSAAALHRASKAFGLHRKQPLARSVQTGRRTQYTRSSSGKRCGGWDSVFGKTSQAFLETLTWCFAVRGSSSFATAISGTVETGTCSRFNSNVGTTPSTGLRRSGEIESGTPRTRLCWRDGAGGSFACGKATLPDIPKVLL